MEGIEDTRRRVIAGLGNPGKQYERTRHNVGFMAVDLLAQRHGLKFDKMMSRGITAVGEINGTKVALVKPQTFMNISGECIGPVLKFYKSQPSDLLVLVDELDIPAADLRLRKSGGAAGHNGMRSIITHVGTQEFARMRIGIGRPPGRMDPADYVVRKFDRGEAALFDDALSRAVDAVEIWLKLGIEMAMNRANKAP